MAWQIFVLISIVTQAVSVLLQRVLMKDHTADPVAYSVVFQLLVAAMFFVFALFQGIKIPNLGPLLPNLILMSILWASSNIFIFSSLKKIEASRFTILFQSRALWTIVIATLLLGESFTLQNAFGTLLIISSVVIVTGGFLKGKFGKGDILALLGAFAFGAGVANDAFLLRSFEPATYMIFAFLIPPILTFAVYPSSYKKMGFISDKKIFLRVLFMAFLFGTAAITTYFAYQAGRNIALIAPFIQLSTILAVVLGVLFLKERSNLFKKSVGAVLSLIGVLFLR